MKQLRCYIIQVLLFTGLYTSATGIKDFEKHFKLMPQPQKIELLNENGLPAMFLQSVFLQGTSARPVLNGVLASLPLTTKPAPGVLILNISTGKNIPSSNEGYVIELRNSEVSVSARSQAGLFYGCQTL